MLRAIGDCSYPVVAEKPLARCADDFEYLRRAKWLYAPFDRRYQESVQKAIEYCRGGALGAIASFSAEAIGPFLVRFSEGAGTYRSSIGRGDGVVTDTGSHLLDTLGLLLGSCPRAMSADVVRNSRGAEIESTSRLHVGKASGLMALRNHEKPFWSVTVIGSEGELRLDPFGCVGEVYGRPVFHSPFPQSSLWFDVQAARAGHRQVWATSEEIVDLSLAVRSVLGSTRRLWRRPRAKALSRLNGAC